MNKQTLCPAEMRQFIGSENWFLHPLVENVLYTDGIRYVASRAGAYWLVDEIAFAQYEPKVKAVKYQLWILDVNEDQSAVLRCMNDDMKEVMRKVIPYTDFPLNEFKVFFIRDVILLPSEY